MAAKAKKYQGVVVGVLGGALLMYAVLLGYDYYRFMLKVEQFKAINCITTK